MAPLLKKQCILLGTVLLLVSPGRADPTTELADPLEVLQAAGCAEDLSAHRTELAEAVARVFDPGARYVEDTERAALEAAGIGRGWAAPVTLGATNGSWIVAGTAADSGLPLETGDRLLRLDGQDVSAQSLPTLYRGLRGSGPDPVQLVTAGHGGVLHTAQVARVQGGETTAIQAEIWPEGLGYLLVKGVYPGSGNATGDQLRDWARTGLSGAILDLRGAAGADPEAVRALASCFTETTSPLYTEEPLDGSPPQPTVSRGETPPINIPVMVLVDEYTTGGAERFAAAAQGGLQGAMLIGRPTRGDFLLRRYLPLSRGGFLYVATSRLRTRDGTVLEGGTGLTPDIVIPAGDEIPAPPPANPLGRRERLEVEQNHLTIRERIGSDAVLHRAVDLLLGLKALNIRSQAAP